MCSFLSALHFFPTLFMFPFLSCSFSYSHFNHHSPHIQQKINLLHFSSVHLYDGSLQTAFEKLCRSFSQISTIIFLNIIDSTETENPHENRILNFRIGSSQFSFSFSHKRLILSSTDWFREIIFSIM